MGGEFIEPSAAVERDGDVISGADYNSSEQVLPDTPTEEDLIDIEEYAVHAAEGIVDTTEEMPVEISAAERAYDEAADKVDRRMDQGLDGAVAWNEVDPTGKIRSDYQAEQDAKRYALSRARNDEIRQATHDAKMAAIAKIPDPVERERAVIELRARERAAEEKRGRRW